MSQDLFGQHEDLLKVDTGNPKGAAGATGPAGSGKKFETFDQRAVVKVCGIGGGGSNAVDRMIKENLTGVDYIVINTDAQALRKSLAPYPIQIGKTTCAGLGAGADPEIGRKACEEDIDQVRMALEGADLVMLAVGLGGGTGTGAAPLVAQVAKEINALSIAFVTLPFSFEGEQRMEKALLGLEELKKHVDTLVVVLNDRILQICTEATSFLDAFRRGDDILYDGVRAITELITVPGLINVDFADLRSIVKVGGRALMGIGTGDGPDRAMSAAQMAIECPLLEQSDIVGAQGVIINVRGGTDMRMLEVEQAINFIKKKASPQARIIFGAVVETQERNDFQVTVIAAGFPDRDYRQHYSQRAVAHSEPAAKHRDKVVSDAATPGESPEKKTATVAGPLAHAGVNPSLPAGNQPAAGVKPTREPSAQPAAHPVSAVQPKPAGARQPVMPAAKTSGKSGPRQQTLEDQPVMFTEVFKWENDPKQSEEKKRMLKMPAFFRRSKEK
ncbi:MAG TPA: cell division protein FtsZ [Candidatus Hydrogenedentes bacterium]|nr:cell division protein FtsZ [Candidatus Hydrogenedentota bacterium]HPU96943.1 cell division protein FtsZ [Candidatus Hydrogenedentota bacterium]